MVVAASCYGYAYHWQGLWLHSVSFYPKKQQVQNPREKKTWQNCKEKSIFQTVQ
jgi:hypothetical protein